MHRCWADSELAVVAGKRLCRNTRDYGELKDVILARSVIVIRVCIDSRMILR